MYLPNPPPLALSFLSYGKEGGKENSWPICAIHGWVSAELAGWLSAVNLTFVPIKCASANSQLWKLRLLCSFTHTYLRVTHVHRSSLLIYLPACMLQLISFGCLKTNRPVLLSCLFMVAGNQQCNECPSYARTSSYSFVISGLNIFSSDLFQRHSL